MPIHWTDKIGSYIDDRLGNIDYVPSSDKRLFNELLVDIFKYGVNHAERSPEDVADIYLNSLDEEDLIVLARESLDKYEKDFEASAAAATERMGESVVEKAIDSLLEN